MSEDDSHLPTLMRPGFLIAPKSLSAKEKEKLFNMKAVDYITNFIADRISKQKNGAPKIKPKTLGDKVIVLKADTGSGKSTSLIYALYEKFQEITRKNIAVTQPRILNAMDISRSMPEYIKELELGRNIGYTTGFSKLPPTEKGIIYMTIGVLTTQLINNTNEEIMNKYSFIILDEVHTRSIETDTCLFLIKRFLEENYDNPNCPLFILASATFDEKIFIDYFKTPKDNFIQVVGKTFPIEANYAEYDVQDYMEYSVLKAQQLHIENLEDIDANNKYRDILIFVQYESAAEKIAEKLHEFNSDILSQKLEDIIKFKNGLSSKIQDLYVKPKDKDKKCGGVEGQNYYVLPIVLSKISFEKGGIEYKNLFSDIKTLTVPLKKSKSGSKTEKYEYTFINPVRRIIIATNIAETGVTIPTLKYCIDTGMVFNVEFNPDFGCMFMTTKNVTKGMAIQRRGRVGRKSPGEWYPCYTEKTFEYLSDDQLSDIILSDTTDNILSILSKENEYELIEETSAKNISKAKENGLFQTNYMSDNSWYKLYSPKNTNISSLDFIEFPSAKSLSYSIEKLHILGMINDDYQLTPIGFYCNKIRFISIECKKMILSGYCYGAYILDLITISSFIYITKRKIFEKNFVMPNFLKRNDKEFKFYHDILIADEWLDCLFIWNLFTKFVDTKLNKLYKSNETIKQLSRDTVSLDNYKSNNKQSKGEHKSILYSQDIKKWCEDMKIKYSGLLDIIAIRDTILENMISIGLNPYYNSLGFKRSEYNLNDILNENLQNGLDEIKKFKQCFYEGFKLNTLKKTKYGYTSIHKNIPLKIKSNLIKELNPKVADQKNPKFVLVPSYMISKKFGSEQYEFNSGEYVSVMDNFIEVDEKFFLR